MSESGHLGPIAKRQHADINLLFRTLADAIGGAVAGSVASLPLTSIQASAIMREVDAGLDVMFGQYSGDQTAALRHIVVRDAAAAQLLPLDAAVRELRRTMPKALRELVESEAQS